MSTAPASLALDTSVIVAAVLAWHEHHERAVPVVQAALDSDAPIVVPLPALVESYSVMTRLPPPHRLDSTAAHRVLVGTFRGKGRIVGLDGKEAWDFLDALHDANIAGGASYDAHILACARKAGAEALATFNRRDFERFDLGGIALLVL